jgi:CheY-like chemotaxis protein
MARIVDDLLDVSRIASGKLDLEASSVDLASIIEAALDSVRPAALAKGIALRLSLAPEGANVLGDASRLQQVVWNLLTNATKFTGAGGRIDVTLERESRTARIIVVDDGIGIAEDVLPQVFSRFWQADASATRRHGGLGLGLSIVRAIVEAHGGTVAAKSEGMGRGTTMTVELPIAETESLPLMRVAEAQLVAEMRLDGARVLLAAEASSAREYLSTSLEQAGAEVRASPCSRDALAMLEAWRPDVLVVDVAMHGEDGYALIGRARLLAPERGGRTPALALTPLARPRDRVRALVAGFQTHLPKPVDPSELVMSVANLWLAASSNEL